MRTYMMGKVSVHDDHKVSRCEMKFIDVCTCPIQLLRRRYPNIGISSIKGDQLVCNPVCVIRRVFSVIIGKVGRTMVLFSLPDFVG